MVIGDFGDGSPGELALADAIERFATGRTIDAIVTTGDNFYIDDADRVWHEPYGWVDTTGIRVLAAWGNHDVETEARRGAVQQALDPPGRWYAEDLGPVSLIVLDSNVPAHPEQLAWLDEALAASAGPIIVAFHHPAFSCGSHGSTPSVIEHWVPRLTAAGVDLVLNGHDHDYERFQADGVTYIVTGGGGRKLRSFGACPRGTPAPLAGNDTDHHFVHLTISATAIVIQAITADGAIIDSVEVPVG